MGSERRTWVRARLCTNGLGAPGQDGFARGRFDPAKRVIRSDPIGRSGVELEWGLIRAGLPGEMADRDTIVPMVGVVDDRWGQRVCAAVVGSATAADVLAYSRTRLAGYKCPKDVFVVDELPVTSTGKVQRSKLPVILGLE